MYTVPEYRGYGLAKRLLEYCVDEGKKVVLNEFGCTLLKMGFTMKDTIMELFL